MSSIFQSKVFWGIALTFVVSGLGGVTGLVSPSASAWIALVLSALTGIGHTTNLLKGRIK